MSQEKEPSPLCLSVQKTFNTKFKTPFDTNIFTHRFINKISETIKKVILKKKKILHFAIKMNLGLL